MDRRTSDVRRNLIRLWNQADISQREAADEMELTQSTISQYLTGRLELNVDIIIKFAKTLNVYPYAIDPSLDWEDFLD